MAEGREEKERYAATVRFSLSLVVVIVTVLLTPLEVGRARLVVLSVGLECSAESVENG